MKTRSLQYKALIIVFAALFLFFLCADFGLPGVNETAVITAVGVEKGDGDEFLLTFVIARMKNDQRENVICSVSGKTVASGVEKIESEFGLTPKLAYTSLVLVEKSVADSGIFDVISFFLNTNGVHDSATLLVAETSPKEIFAAKTQTGEEGADTIGKILKVAENVPISIPKINLKDFAESYFTMGEDASIPSVGVDENGVLNIGKGYIFRGNTIACEVADGEVLAYNILKNKGEEGSFTVKVPIDGVENDVRLSVVKSNCKVAKKLQLGVASIFISCDLTVGLLDQNNSQNSISQVCGIAADKEGIASAVSSQIQNDIQSLMEKSLATDADFLGIRKELSRKNRSQEQEVLQAETLLKNANVIIDVSVEVLQSYRL